MATITNYQHGSLSTVTVNNATICLTSFDIDDTSELADTTSTCSGGWREQIAGLKQVSGTINGNLDLLNLPESTLGLVRGALVALILKFSASSYYSMNANISDIKFTVDVGDVIKFTASFKSNGPVTTTGI